ncbi:hypothetical protein Glove_367g8 [Diversispora epigaea]|uniref:Uncharacterized protein n=1 Tax=Diversispora epigaea TaxID=1348612 RepID=A0A397H741_9GLOM|nr:hypothetical protein Glove_367g8 [Diversispora epigaea]
MGEQNLEKKIHHFDQEREGWDRERNKLGQKLGGANTETQKLYNHTLELIDEVKRLQIEKTRQDISHAESIAKNATKTEEIKLLRNEMKTFKGKLALSQKDSLNKGSEIESLKFKIVELALKVSELECLKSEDILDSIVGGDDEKNTVKSDSQSEYVFASNNGVSAKAHISTVIEPSKSLRPYLARRKIMEEAKKNDDNIEASAKAHIPVYTRPLLQSNDPSGLDTSKRHDEISEPPKVDTENTTKVSDEISGACMANISEINNSDKLDASIIPDTPPDVAHISSDVPSNMPKSVAPYLAQWEGSVKTYLTSSLIKSNSQIPIEEIEAIPVMASTFMSSLSAYMLLTLLIIMIIWFVVLRRTWGLDRKSDQLRGA